MRDSVAALARVLAAPHEPSEYARLFAPARGADPVGARVRAVRRCGPDVTRLWLEADRRWRGHRAGQWTTIGIDVDGVRHRRPFSISSAPRLDRLLEVTVRAVPGGVVSPKLVYDTGIGAVVELTQAAGDFVVPGPRRPLLFITAGSGVTPVMSMLRELATGPRAAATVTMIHSARRAEEAIFGPELRTLAETVPWFRYIERNTLRGNRFRPAELDSLCPDWRRRSAYACGPSGLLDACADHWAAADLADRLALERFALPPPAATEGGTVRFLVSAKEFRASGGLSLLEARERAGIAPPSGCRMGICFACAARLRAGRVRDLRTGRVQHGEGQPIRTCTTTAAGDVALDL
ncbi:flavin reductase family protein [Nocardia sp. NPDC004068]|uniref:flavin reductase family protein n=1 Tax=Nocardia sp. NPDC004068 TaxID=3364303 RepID=UPI003687787B